MVGPSTHRRTCRRLEHALGNSRRIFRTDGHEAKYGSDSMHRFLKHELDQYLRGRAGEIRKERPVVLVQNEPYVWYQKGGQVMYTLADYIGEGKLNLALHNFLLQYRYGQRERLAERPLP